MTRLTLKAALTCMLLIESSSAFMVPSGKAHGIHSRLYESEASFQDDFVDKQKKVSGNNKRDVEEPSVQDYLKHQREVFDDMSEFFNSDEATPPEVEPILFYLVKKTLAQTIEGKEEKKVSLLDVGCGTGALFPWYLKAADELGIELDIKGLDLSPKMTMHANENGKKLIGDGGKHSIHCETGDFVEKVMGIDFCEKSLIGFDSGVTNDDTSVYRGVFDAVMINACFGNFFDSESTVTAAATCLKNDGVFVIGHPLGAEFVEKLGKENPSTVPRRLPGREALDDMLQFQPMEVLDYVEEDVIENESTTLYFASSRKKPHRMLREVLRLRGPVDEGYGRGGKKLGFPTANLPSSRFANALENVPTGVYIGSALIEGLPGEKKGRNVVHKAVVNVGYSPTFDGQENKEKIVEAHLIIGDTDIEGDFYGETMRLALSGFLRPEMKFPSFPDLINAITSDVKTADISLDHEPYSTFGNDPFLTESIDEWVGAAGGDNVASYEFESTLEYLSGK